MFVSGHISLAHRGDPRWHVQDIQESRCQDSPSCLGNNTLQHLSSFGGAGRGRGPFVGGEGKNTRLVRLSPHHADGSALLRRRAVRAAVSRRRHLFFFGTSENGTGRPIAYIGPVVAGARCALVDDVGYARVVQGSSEYAAFAEFHEVPLAAAEGTALPGYVDGLTRRALQHGTGLFRASEFAVVAAAFQARVVRRGHLPAFGDQLTVEQTT